MIILKYEKRFIDLSRFFLSIVAIEIEKCDHFELGLNPSIQGKLDARVYTSYYELVAAASKVKAINALTCQIKERNHPKGGNTNSSQR